MKKSFIERNKHLLAGIFFLLLQLYVFYANYQSTNFDILFWFCNHSPLLFGLAFILKRIDFIKALINFGFLAQFFWTVDFIGKFFFDFYIFNVTNYVFEDINGVYVLIPILVHVLGTNLALFLVHHRKPKLKILIYSLVYVILLYGASLSYTDPERNINCVQYICGAQDYTFNGYTYFWPVLIFFFVVLPTHGIQCLLYFIHLHKKPGERLEDRLHKLYKRLFSLKFL